MAEISEVSAFHFVSDFDLILNSISGPPPLYRFALILKMPINVQRNDIIGVNCRVISGMTPHLATREAELAATNAITPQMMLMKRHDINVKTTAIRAAYRQCHEIAADDDMPHEKQCLMASIYFVYRVALAAVTDDRAFWCLACVAPGFDKVRQPPESHCGAPRKSPRRRSPEQTRSRQFAGTSLKKSISHAILMACHKNAHELGRSRTPRRLINCRRHFVYARRPFQRHWHAAFAMESGAL